MTYMSAGGRGGAAVVLAAVALAACGDTVDLSPVPAEASGPYVCDGVGRRGPELILGGPVTVASTEQPGTRTLDPLWRCSLDAGEGHLAIRDELLTASDDFGRDEKAALQVMRSLGGAQPIEADFPGQGYSGGRSAMWVCNGRALLVSQHTEPLPERDARQDVTNLLLSQLPFVCDGIEMPMADDAAE